MKNLGYYNGTWDEIENMTIPMGDRVCFFGDGVYDATYSRNYKIFSLDEHVDRFYSSAKLLEIDLPNDQIMAVAEFIKTKINMDKLGNALGGLKGLFGK